MRFSPIEDAGLSLRTALRAAVDRLRLRSGQSRGDSESGQAIVEMAYMAPVLLLLTFGMCMFGLAINQQLVLTNAVQVGAQQLAISRGTTDPCATAVAAVKSAAPNLNWSATGITWTVDLNGASAGTTCSGTTLTAGESSSITVSYPFTNGIIGSATPSPAGGWSFASSFSLYASTSEVIQ